MPLRLRQHPAGCACLSLKVFRFTCSLLCLVLCLKSVRFRCFSSDWGKYSLFYYQTSTLLFLLAYRPELVKPSVFTQGANFSKDNCMSVAVYVECILKTGREIRFRENASCNWKFIYCAVKKYGYVKRECQVSPSPQSFWLSFTLHIFLLQHMFGNCEFPCHIVGLYR